MSEICLKLPTEVTGVVLVSLLLTSNIFDTFLVYVCFVLFFVEFEHVNAGLNTLLPYQSRIKEPCHKTKLSGNNSQQQFPAISYS